MCWFICFIDAFLAAFVVFAALFLVREHLVGISHVVELLFGFVVTWVLIGVVLQSQFPVGLFDLISLGIFLEIQDLVEIAFLLCHSEIEHKSEQQEHTASH